MIYVHIPFCRSFCTYCDFYSEVASRCRKAEDALKQEALFGEFAEAVSAEAVARGSEIGDEVNTLYIGGGTPSVLPLSAFRRIVGTLASLGQGAPVAFDGMNPCLCAAGSVFHDGGGQSLPFEPGVHGRPFDEFTVEVNPEDIVEKGHAYIEGLLELGVNRVSMGVQSFDDSVLHFMNRRHSAAEAVRAYAILEEAGVRNISIDLIFGLPQLSMARWRETLDKALSISSRGVLPQHISSYQLSVESGSMLARLVEKGRWSEASEEVCQQQYAELCSVLASAGYNHYEISNFAQPGYEARHNSAYWSHIPYVGLGPGAHSFIPVRSEVSSSCCGDAPLPPSPCHREPSAPPSCHCERSAAIPTTPCQGDSPASPSCHCEARRAAAIPLEATRTWNRPDLQAYLAAHRHGDFSPVREGETLTPDQLILEHMMLGLRTSAGLPAAWLRTHCTPDALSRALSLGHLVPVPETPSVPSPCHCDAPSPCHCERSAAIPSGATHGCLASIPAGSHLRIPERHFFISDSIISALV